MKSITLESVQAEIRRLESELVSARNVEEYILSHSQNGAQRVLEKKVGKEASRTDDPPKDLKDAIIRAIREKPRMLESIIEWVQVHFKADPIPASIRSTLYTLQRGNKAIKNSDGEWSLTEEGMKKVSKDV